MEDRVVDVINKSRHCFEAVETWPARPQNLSTEQIQFLDQLEHVRSYLEHVLLSETFFNFRKSDSHLIRDLEGFENALYSTVESAHILGEQASELYTDGNLSRESVRLIANGEYYLVKLYRKFSLIAGF